jgi:hypothetical protein
MSKLLALETRAVALMEAATYFSDVIIRAQHHGDIAAVIAQRLAAAGMGSGDTKKPGLLVLCSVTGADSAIINNAKLRVRAGLTIAVLENPLVNQSAQGNGKAALDVAEEVLKTIFNQPIHDVHPGNAPGVFELADSALELLTPDTKRARYGVEGGTGYETHFTAREAL